MWVAGVLVAMSSITYPSISAFVSILSDKDKQGTVQGVVTGIRGLCQGGWIFLYTVNDLQDSDQHCLGSYSIYSMLIWIRMERARVKSASDRISPQWEYIQYRRYGRKYWHHDGMKRHLTMWVCHVYIYVLQPEQAAFNWQLIPGPPFLVGAFLVLLALFVNSALPTTMHSKRMRYVHISLCSSHLYSSSSPCHSRQSSDQSRLLSSSSPPLHSPSSS